MVMAARALLAAVTRLLILADMVDVHILLGKVTATEEDLKFVLKSSSQPELMEGMRRLERSVAELCQNAARRRRELKSPELRDRLAEARGLVARLAPLLLTSSNVHVRYPDIARTRDNREDLHREVLTAVQTIGSIATGGASHHQPHTEDGATLLILLQDTVAALQTPPATSWLSAQHRKERARKLNLVIDGVREHSGLVSVRQHRREHILQVCTSLQTYINANLETVNIEPSHLMETVKEQEANIKKLQRLLRCCVVDQVSDLFINCLHPINSMLAQATRGSKQDIHIACNKFSKQVEHFSNMTDLICSMTENDEGRRMVRMSCKQLVDLKTKLENAVTILAHIPESKAAMENVNVFKKAWVEQVRTFMDAVDDLINVRDFLSVGENHVLEDVKTCCKAMQVQDIGKVGEHARAIYQRSGRLCDVVTGDMERYEPGLYTEKALKSNGETDENELIEV